MPTANVGKIRINVTGSNIAPTAASSTSVLKAGTENVPLTITYAELKSKYQVNDIDSSWLALVITEVNNGTLRKGGNVITPFTGAPGTPPATSIVAPGESIIFFPAANYNANPATIFKFVVYDGASFSDADTATANVKDPVPVTVNLQPVNTPPTLNASAVLDGSLAAARNTTYSVTFDQIAEKLDVRDVENISTDPSVVPPLKYQSVKMRIDQILGGSELRNNLGAIDGTNNILLQGQTLTWEPPNNQVGTFDAFVVTILDSDNLESLTTGTVSILVNGETQKPVIDPAKLNVQLSVDGKQNTAYSISHEQLK
ncbi:MAG: hypothetical protein ACO35F_11900, partial [Ilumatobacteraceae bacterium]